MPSRPAGCACAALTRPRFRAVRPCRLARPAVGHCGDGRVARRRHARAGSSDGALARRAGTGRVGVCDRVRRGRGGGRRVKAFAQLYVELDATTSTIRKLDALKRYYASAGEADAAWATYFLAGGRPRQAVPTKLLRECAIEFSALPAWLFEECYQAVGDFAETVADVLPPPVHESDIG